jgi:hypothetical protein
MPGAADPAEPVAVTVEPIGPASPYHVGWLALALRPVTRAYDLLDHTWHRLMHGRWLAIGLSTVFVGGIVLIELNRRGLLPPSLAAMLETRHFGAVVGAFWVLLVFEILALVFTLPQSVANSVGKQFELVSLIMLREAFLEFTAFGEPIDVAAHGYHSLFVVVSDLLAAFAVFVLIGVYYRLQHHQPITPDEREQASFIAAKKVIALALFGAFVVLAFAEGVLFLQHRQTFDFFADFFTILIFADVLVVLVSLAFTSGYHVVFRNSGFAAAAVIIRLALPAPPFVSPALAVGAALFAVALTAAYNFFAPTIRQRG